ncbi:sugar ABC transporter ATP-binding protein [Candidatus Mycoplasma pogonae]
MSSTNQNKHLDELIFQLSNINISFGDFKVLKNINLKLYKGKGVALVGENGAGKSTLMKILSGIYQPNNGTMSLCEKNICNHQLNFNSIKDSQSQGIAIIHQEQQLLNNLTVADNIFIGNEPGKYGFVNHKQQNAAAQKLLDQLNVDFKATDLVENLSLSQKQFIEIAKALSLKPKIMIFDEPTSVLTKKDTVKLYEIVNKLKQQGTSIVWITHRMEEIIKTCEYITIIKNGYYVADGPIANFKDENHIISLMIGADIKERYPQKELVDNNASVSFEVKHLNSEILKDVSFQLRKGEIVGFYALVGAGRTELAQTIIGALPYSSGSFSFNDKKYFPKNIKHSLDEKIYYLSEDRKELGLNLNKAIDFNISLASLQSCFLNPNLPLVMKKKIEKKAEKYAEILNIATENIYKNVGDLSGGNQQKVAIAKGLATQPEFIILDEPTRGVDVGARREIYNLIHELKKQAKTIMFISSDIKEMVGIADRVIVMYKGKITAELKGQSINEENILKNALNLGEGSDAN